MIIVKDFRGIVLCEEQNTPIVNSLQKQYWSYSGVMLHSSADNPDTSSQRYHSVTHWGKRDEESEPVC